MNTQQLTALETWFQRYVDSFCGADQEADIRTHVEIKRLHTRRVCQAAARLADGRDAGEQRLIAAAALLHDVGRFRQYERYRTFNDALSCNHGELGLAVLREEQILMRLAQAPLEQTALEQAVLLHNRRHLPPDLPPLTALLAKMVRDADKLDIFAMIVSGEMPVSREFRPDNACHPAMVDDILAGRLARFEHIQTAADQMLFRLSWLYDLNFKATLAYVAAAGYLPKMAAALPDTPAVRQITAQLERYLAERLAAEIE